MFLQEHSPCISQIVHSVWVFWSVMVANEVSILEFT